MAKQNYELSVLLVEDHQRMGEAIARFLEEMGQIRVVAIATSGEQALERLPNLNIDLAIVDVSLPKMSGIDLVLRLKKLYPGLPCLMLSGHKITSYVERSLKAGARGYVLKGNSEAILEGIYQVMKGGTYVSEELQYTSRT